MIPASLIRKGLRLYAFSFFFRKKEKKDRSLALAHRSIRSKPTYRLPARDQEEWAAPLWIIGRSIRSLFSYSSENEHPFILDHEGKEDRAVFDTKAGNTTLRKDFIAHFGEDYPKSYFAREHLPKHLSQGDKLLYALIFFLFLPLLLFQRTERAKKALIPWEMMEGTLLLKGLKEREVRSLYVFGIYQKDSDLLAYWLRKEGVEVKKISSDPPLHFYNHTIITDALICCNAYQKKEAELLKESVLYDKLEVWGPESFLNYVDLYVGEKRKNPPHRTIGIYSNGVYVRSQAGHIDPGIGTFPTERDLIENVLPALIPRMEGFIFTIFLHPKEKGDKETLEIARSYYREHLGDQVEIPHFEEGTPYLFDQVDIAVGAFSVSLMERLYCGFKTLFYTSHFDRFPISDGSLEHLCSKDPEELKNALLELDELREQEVLERYQLNSHTFDR